MGSVWNDWAAKAQAIQKQHDAAKAASAASAVKPASLKSSMPTSLPGGGSSAKEDFEKANPASTSSSILQSKPEEGLDVPTGYTTKLLIPAGIIKNQVLSNTSNAQLCFMHQRFSRKLQMYMVMYVTAVTSFYTIPAV